MTQNVAGSFEVAMSYFITPKVTVNYESFWPIKVTGSLEVAMTFFMTQKVKVNFVVNLT